MRYVRSSLIRLFVLCLAALVAGCGSTGSGGGTTSDAAFSLSAQPSLSIVQGQSASLTVTPEASGGFTGTVQISVSGMPSGVTISPATAAVVPGKGATFTLTAASGAPVGAANLVVQGSSGSLSAGATVGLTVMAASGTPPAGGGDFTLTTSPTTLNLTPGQSAQLVLSSTGTQGFAGTISVAVHNLPEGVTASPASISLSPGNPAAVTLTASAVAPPTAAPAAVSFVGTSGALTHTVSVQVSVTAVVSAAPDFSITATPAAISVAQGTQSDEVMMGISGVNGFSGSVAIAVSGLPAGVIAIPPSVSSLQAGQSTPIVFVASDSAPLGNATVTLTGTSGSLSHTAAIALTVAGPPPVDFVAVAASPQAETVFIGSANTVSITATATEGYTGPVALTVQGLPAGVTVYPASASLTPGVPRTFTIAASQSAAPGSTTVTFAGQINSMRGTAALGLTVARPPANVDVPTWHYDNLRDGLNPAESSLTPSTVGPASFGRLRSASTDGAVDAQPLYLSNLAVGATSYNVLFAATENDSVYAWDAATGTTLWRASALASGETAADNQGCGELPAQVGISATPAIDRNFGTDGAMFFVAKSKDASGGYHQRLHALDLATGAELNGSPVEIAAVSGQANTFAPAAATEQAALLVENGAVYLSWAFPCQESSSQYGGWVMAYDEGTLAPISSLDLTPGGSGGGTGMSGAGPAGDASGNVYLVTSAGTFDTALSGGKPAHGDYGNGYVRLSLANGALSVTDYFEPLDGIPGSANYADQGSGGAILTAPFLDGSYTVPSFLVGAGGDGNVYMMAANGAVTLGGYNGSTNADTLTVTGALPHGAATAAAALNGTVYYAASSDSVKAFNILSRGALTSQSSSVMGSGGATPVVSASGTGNAILWLVDTTASGGPVLHAYDATNLATELYNSSARGGDAIGPASAHAVPVVANGNVYVGTRSGVLIYGATSGH